jgi:hypothetical protein
MKDYTDLEPIPDGFDKLPEYEGDIYHGCLHCPPVTRIADLDIWVAVGFGYAAITKDGEEIYHEPFEMEESEIRTLREFEQMAQSDPNHDWRCILDAPLRSREYQRQARDKWVLVKSGMGFA